MATARLDERRKQEMAERYRAGESSTSLAQTYGCSPNTVTRTVRAVLGDEAFEQLKQQRGRPVAQRARQRPRARPIAATRLPFASDARIGSFPAD
jgi:transposase